MEENFTASCSAEAPAAENTSPRFGSDPEVASGSIVVKVFNAYRFQKKGFLIRLGITAEIR